MDPIALSEKRGIFSEYLSGFSFVVKAGIVLNELAWENDDQDDFRG